MKECFGFALSHQDKSVAGRDPESVLEDLSGVSFVRGI